MPQRSRWGTTPTLATPSCAGTITANYDGEKKHATKIGAGVFTGVGTLIVAPLTMGDRSKTGAGAVVLKDVPAGALVVGVPARMVGGA